MRDRFRRPLKGLRVSVTEDCNFKCMYCHREGCPKSSRRMTPEEIGEAIGLATEFGVEKVKLTGGEPLIRDDIVDVVVASIRPGIREVSITTNGSLLSGFAHDLVRAGLTRVNVSLDTLSQGTFSDITGNGSIQDVFSGIDAALDAGLKPVKLNMVLLSGINEHEVEPMIEFSHARGMVLQLIELVDLNGEDFESYYTSLDEIERRIAARAVSVRTRRYMQSRKKYFLPSGEVEIVRPMHNTAFCANCTRLRLTPDGFLKPCIMRNDNLVDILSPIRAGDEMAARRAFIDAINLREPFFKGESRNVCVHASA